MRILTPSLALVLGLALAPAAAMAQAANVSVPPPNPKASVTSPSYPTQVGSGANNTKPVGGPGVNDYAHKKYHKRAHHKFYGRHHDYTKSSPAKGPTAPHLKETGTE
ncbi:hypothetical protein [Acidisoma sp.]|uniref:hypothetical protein n=1 Tax=Acidisoma sp. TaxID=1872115 RepID=UPI003B002795